MCDPDLLETLLTLGFASVLIVMDSSAVVLPNFDLELLHKKALQRFVFNHSSRFTPIILISKSDCETIEDHSEIEDYRQKYFIPKCHKICRLNNEPQISGRHCFQGCWNKCNKMYFIRKALDG